MKANICPVCAIIGTNSSYVFGYQPYTGLIAHWGKIYNQGEGFKIIAEGEDEVVYYPKYCPECGKKVGA